MLFREIIAVYSDDHKEHTNTLCGQNAATYSVKQVVCVTIPCRVWTPIYNSLS
jgi:hypothetical protein